MGERWYFLLRFGYERQTETLLEAFEHLPEEEKRTFTLEVLRRSLPFASGPLADEDIGAASAALFQSLDEDEAFADHCRATHYELAWVFF